MIITRIKRSGGFSLLELVIAIAIFAFASFAMGAMLIDSNVSTNVSIERTEALLYTKEGIEVVRSIRDNDFAAWSVLADGNHGLSINTSSSTWVLSGIADILDTKFTRVVNISSSSTAPFLKNISVTVDWPLASGRLASTTLETVISNWINVRNLPSQIPTDGLVSYWSFDDALSGTVVDNFGTSTGTVYGATSTPGVRSYGYSFDGISNVITTPSFVLSKYLTVCFWVKPGVSKVAEMVLHGTAGSSGFELYQSNLDVSLRGGLTSPSVTATSTLSLGNWSFLCGTIDDTSGTIYVDGQYLTSGSVATPNLTSKSVAIGAYANSQYPFNGTLDQIRIYNRVLTPYEVNVIYDEEKLQ